MKKLTSLILAVIMLFSALSVQSAVYASGREFALDHLQTIQKTKGYIPKQTAAVTGNCYGFVSSVCGKLYGVQYNGEGLYNSYQCRHSSGNYKTVSTYKNKNGTLTRSDADKIISFFVDNAVSGDIVHFGALQKTNSHTFMVQSVDNEKMVIYHSNYASKGNTSNTCHFDTIYWDSFRSSPTKSATASNGDYSLNAMFYAKMSGGLGITINRYTKYESKFYLLKVTVPSVDCINASTTSLKLQWSEISGASKYQIQYKKSTDSSFANASTGCTATSFEIKNLTPGVTYNFKVRANIGGKWMDYSDVESKKVVPPAVSGVKFSTTADGLKLSWSNLNDFTGIKVLRSTSQSGAYSQIAQFAPASSYIDTNVEYGKTYYYKIIRYYGGDSISSTSAVCSGAYKLTAPSVSAVRNDSRTITFTVKGDSSAKSYVYSVADSHSNPIVDETEDDSNTVQIENLAVGEIYTLTVAEKSNVGTGDFATKSIKAGSTAIKNVKASAVSNGVQVKYDTQFDASGYYIYRSESASSGYKRIGDVQNTQQGTYTDKSVKYNKQYYYKVSAYIIRNDVKNEGEISLASSGVKNSLSAPKITAASRVNSSSIKVSWSRVTNAQKYTLVYKADGGKWKTYSSTTGTSITVKKLSVGTKYHFKVYASNSIGSSSYSADKTQTALPAAPVRPSLKKQRGSIKVSWKKSLDASGYKVYRATSKNGSYKLVKTVGGKNTTSFTDKSVKRNKTYYYKVCVYTTKNKKSHNSSKSAYSSLKY